MERWWDQSMAATEVGSLETKAKKSTTWVPCVLVIVMVWFCCRGTATPERAGRRWVLLGG
jgi:hypothetical protein